MRAKIQFLFIPLLILGAQARLQAGESIVPIAWQKSQPEGLVAAADPKGAIVSAWMVKEGTASWIGAQRVDMKGRSQWGTRGIQLASNESAKTDLKIESDRNGGVIFAWKESAGSQNNLLLQHVDDNGKPQWPEPGRVVYSGELSSPLALETDEKGKVAWAWGMVENGTFTVRMQWMTARGQMKWKEGGLPLATVAGPLTSLAMARDRQGGFFIVWRSSPSLEPGADSVNAPLLAQSIDADGRRVWDERGMTVAPRVSAPAVDTVIATPQNDLVVVWRDRSQAGDNWGAQVLNSSGQRLWSDDGAPLVQESADQENASIAVDDNGGLTGAWEDSKSDPRKVMVQQWDERGLPVWGDDGVAVVNPRSGEQRDPLVLNAGKDFMVLWRDSANYPWELYTQRIRHGRTESNAGIAVAVLGPLASRPVAVRDSFEGLVVLWSEHAGPVDWLLQALRMDRAGAPAWK